MGERLDWIDGLRGVAVGMVVLCHATEAALGGHIPQAGWTALIVSLGPQGVSLFFVLSGLCLSLRPLERRQQGRADWFDAGQFFLRRALRILPPYYVALLLCTALTLTVGGAPLWTVGVATTPADILPHVLLLHNLWIGHEGTINGPFWSLAVEWQWYLVFPAALLIGARAPRIMLPVALMLALVTPWLAVTIVHATPDDQFLLSGRLVELTLGIIVARWFIAGRAPGRSLVALFLLTGALIEMPTVLGWGIVPLLLRIHGLYFPVCGALFAAVVGLTGHIGVVRAVVRWRPLVVLGEASYSTYLIHAPVVMLTGMAARHAGFAVPVATGMALAGGMLAGVAFHAGIERPCLRWCTVASLAQLQGWLRTIPVGAYSRP